MSTYLRIAPAPDADGIDPDPAAAARGPVVPTPPASAPVAAPRSVLSTAGWVLLTLSALSLWAVVYAMLLSGRQEARAQHLLHATFREHLALDTVPVGGDIPVGTPIASVDAPTIGVHDLVVVEGTGALQLEGGPGHRRDTPLPGQPGASVLMGRSTTFGAPFADLTRLHRGDRISVVTGDGSFRFSVRDVRRAGDPLPAALTAGSGRLTLVTSTRHGATGALESVSVDADLIGAAKAPPPAKIKAIRADEAPMAGDEGALPPLALWLAGLLAAAVAASWAQARWARRPTLLVAVPTLLALLWGATETAVRLLPNLL